MKVTMKLTLDGLVKALRAKAHAMADEVESRYAAGSAGTRDVVWTDRVREGDGER